MNETPINFELEQLSKRQILDNESISWTIKSELLEAEESYIVKFDENPLNDPDSTEVKYMRKFNKQQGERCEFERFYFTLYGENAYYITNPSQIDNNSDDLLYSDELLEQYYNDGQQ